MSRQEYMREYQRNWVAARRASYFEDKSCYACGSTEQLEIDHVNPKTKVSNSIWSWSKKRQEEELAKCEVMCRKCHKLKTLLFDAILAEHGTLGGYDAGCRCESCTESKRLQMRRLRSLRGRKSDKTLIRS